MKIAKKTHVATLGAFDWAGIFGVVCELDCSYEVKISRGEWTLVYIIFCVLHSIFHCCETGRCGMVVYTERTSENDKKRKKKTVT